MPWIKASNFELALRLELLTWDFDPQRFTSMSSLDDVEKQKPTRTLLRQ